MKRILITGNAGSGKSTLARKISDELDIPFHSLDRIVWKSGWRRASRNEKNRMIAELTNQEHWVIDGVSLLAQDEADTVVFLDVPRRVSFWRTFKRNWRYMFRSRPELPPKCPEILIIPTLCRIIWNFPKTVRTRILDRMNSTENSQRCFHLKTNNDISRFLTEIRGTQHN